MPANSYYNYLRYFVSHNDKYVDLISTTGHAVTVYSFDLGESGQVIDNVTKYIKVLPIPDDYTAEGDTFHFDGWYTSDGIVNGNWGTQISTSPYINDSGTNVTLYAKFASEKRMDGSQLFPWLINDTEFTHFTLTGEANQQCYFKFFLKTQYVAGYVNGMLMFSFPVLVPANQNYVFMHTFLQQQIDQLTDSGADLNNLTIKLLFFNTIVELSNPPLTIPVN